jgi:hypothetical protein
MQNSALELCCLISLSSSNNAACIMRRRAQILLSSASTKSGNHEYAPRTIHLCAHFPIYWQHAALRVSRAARLLTLLCTGLIRKATRTALCVCVPLMFHLHHKNKSTTHSLYTNTQHAVDVLRHNLFIYSPFISLSISMEHRSNIFILPAAAPPAQSSGKSLVISQVAWCRDTPRLRDMERASSTTHIINPASLLLLRKSHPRTSKFNIFPIPADQKSNWRRAIPRDGVENMNN